MLQSLSIRDVVLIKHLDLSFDEGLVVLTGETGAGKSILLDALGLALGVRAEVRLVRHGAKQAVVSATFNIRLENSIDKILDKHGLEVGNNELILRRVLTSNGKSRSFINDHPVSVSLLKKIGETLVEVHKLVIMPLVSGSGFAQVDCSEGCNSGKWNILLLRLRLLILLHILLH